LRKERNQRFLDIFGKEFREEEREREYTNKSAPKCPKFFIFNLRGLKSDGP